jgi:hypothetical protein
VPQVNICDRCNTLLPTPYTIVQGFQSDASQGQTPIVKWCCLSCTAELVNFFNTLPTWGVSPPAVVPLQTVPAKVG